MGFSRQEYWSGLPFPSPTGSHKPLHTNYCTLQKTVPVIQLEILSENWASLVTQMVKNLPAMKETRVQSLVWEDSLEKGMVIHSSILAWRIPWTEEPGRLQSVGLVSTNMSLTASQYIKTFLESLLEILTDIIFILYNEMCQHLEGLNNSLIQYFPNYHCMLLPNLAWIKYLFKIQDRQITLMWQSKDYFLIWFQILYYK